MKNRQSLERADGFAALMQTLGQELSVTSAVGTFNSNTHLVAVAAILVALIVAITLAGWLFHIRLLQSWGPQLATMKVNTALGLGLTALTLWLSRTPDCRKRHGLLIWVLLGMVSAVALITLAEYAFNWNAGIDELVLPDPEHQNAAYPHGRMAPATALCFLLLSCALILIDRFRRTSQGLILLTFLVSLIGLVGYVYHLPSVYGADLYTSLALHTVFGFALLCLGGLAARADVGLTGLLVKSWAQHSTLHTFAAGAVLLPLALGSMVLSGQRNGLYGGEFTLALYTVLLIVVLVGMVWTAGAEKQDLQEKRLRMQEALLDSEERFRAMADNIPNLAWMALTDGRIFWYNQRWYEYTGTTLDQMRDRGWQTVHDAEILPVVTERWKAALAAGSRFEMVFPLRGKDGVYRPFLTRIEPVKDDEGHVARWFGTSTDIGAEREVQAQLEDASHKLAVLNAHLAANNQTLIAGEERLRDSLLEKEVLLREVHHRVKNNLQIISSLLSMQVSQTADPAMAAVLRDSEARVRAMALIHELLYQNEQFSSIDFAAYVRLLVPLLRESYQMGTRIECVLQLSPTELTLEQAIPCALILNELMTNSLKYAYPGGNGEILITLATEQGWTTVTVQDYGVGLPIGFDTGKATSFGLTIVRALTEQLDGEYQFDPSQPGSTFTIRFPRAKTAVLSQAAHA